MSSSSRARLILISAAFLFVGAIFVYIGGSTVLEQRRYRQQGVRVDAIVTGKTLRRATTTTDTAYEITYQFNLSEGAPYQQTESVGVPLWERVERGSPLTVEYVSGAPASARAAVDGSDDNTTAIGALGVATGLVLIVLIGWVVLLKSGRSRRFANGGVSLPQVAAAPEVTEPVGKGSSVGASQQRSFWPLARRSFGFWFGGFSLLIGLPWFVVNGVIPFYADWRFAQEGRSIPGMVLTKEIRRSGNTRSETLHYEVTYRFAVRGETIEGRDELALEDWERLIEREPADVLYRAQQPSSNRLASRPPAMALEDFLRIARIGLYEHYRHNDFEYSRKNWGRAHRIFAGQGDIEGQIRWRWWRKETDSRPEVFSFAEVVLPHPKTDR